MNLLQAVVPKSNKMLLKNDVDMSKDIRAYQKRLPNGQIWDNWGEQNSYSSEL